MPPPPPWALRFRDRRDNTPHSATNATTDPQTLQYGQPNVGIASNRTTPGPRSSVEVRIQPLKSISLLVRFPPLVTENISTFN